jgi:DMSO/TMAO reductase YedYZ heme-binding membrane subunit
MAFGKGGYVFLGALIIFASAVSVLSFSIASADPFELSVRLLALNGFLALSVATMMTPFLKEIRNAFNKPFLTVHHSFAAVGLTLITLHPVALSIQTLDPTVFLPNFGSFYQFWMLAGRPALIIIYIAFAAALLRRKMIAYWRIGHAFMYVALFFGIVHANLSGTDFQNIAVSVVFNALFIGSIAAFGLKRLQQHRIKSLRKSSK